MTEESWVSRVQPAKPPSSPWRALGWVLVTVTVLIAPAAVLAGWRFLL
jgi:hypothetical protein